MRLQAINTTSYFNVSPKQIATNKNSNNNNTQQTKPYPNYTNYNKLLVTPPICSISFMGYRVHIVDGSNHATNMKHFTQAISKDMDVEMHDVEVNPWDKNMKQLKSLENELRLLNCKNKYNDEFIAVPALASIPLLNLQDQYNRVMLENKQFTPENIKANKKNIIEFLKKLYNEPQKYEKYINYMDPNKQGIAYTYGVIKEINKLKEKGALVYIPSGHPQDTTLKWLAGDRNLKPELYHFIATGEDKDNSIAKIYKEIKDNNWYDFNLLSLSDANVVGVKGAAGAQDYMFAAYDSCISDGARGVYNFSPVRNDNGKLIGYSYTDTRTNEYPYDEFPANDEVANLAQFVGKEKEEVTANKEETNELIEKLKNSNDTRNCADKLYSVNEVFSQEYIHKHKINLQGKYVDRSLKLFFDINNDNKVIFPKCDCEGSGKPSVLSMWGSCFAVFNAISRDIKLKKRINCYQNLERQNNYINGLINQCHSVQNTKAKENFLNYIIEEDRVYQMEHTEHFLNYEPHYLLGELHFKNGNYKYASSCYNHAIDILSKSIIQKDKTNLANISAKNSAYIKSKRDTEEYDDAIIKYNTKSTLGKFFSGKPIKPYNYRLYLELEKYKKLYNDIRRISMMYDNIGIMCSIAGEKYPAEVCHAAAESIRQCSKKGEKVIERRAEGVQYIGDLYNEISKY